MGKGVGGRCPFARPAAGDGGTEAGLLDGDAVRELPDVAKPAGGGGWGTAALLCSPAVALTVVVAAITYPAMWVPFVSARDALGMRLGGEAFDVEPARGCLYNLTGGVCEVDLSRYPYQSAGRDAGSAQIGAVLAWALYALHQIGMWGSIALRRSCGNRPMLATHAAFVPAKIAHSYVFYDGLAPQVPETLALYSVSLFLWAVVVLRSAHPADGGRGLFWGWGTLPQDFREFVRDYHGYVLAFGVTFNFWYHPVEGTPAFIAGFMYQFLLITQSALIGCPAHMNPVWTGLLEFFVVVHAGIVAALQHTGLPFMFISGFGLSTAVNQLGYAATPKLLKWGANAACAAYVAWYAKQNSVLQASASLRIPGCAVAIVFYGLVAFRAAQLLGKALRCVGVPQCVINAGAVVATAAVVLLPWAALMLLRKKA